MERQKRFILPESELPRQWYNIQAEMPNKPLPPIHPQTREPMTAEDLSHIFAGECAKSVLKDCPAAYNNTMSATSHKKYVPLRFTPKI